MPSQMLSLEQSQQLQMVLAPQLRQSLQMLQMPVMELRAMAQQELERNPTLEEAPSRQAEPEQQEPAPAGPDTTDELNFDKEFEALAKLDDEWREYFFQDLESQPYTQERAEKRKFFFDSLPQKESLQEHLVSQAQLAGLSGDDMEIAKLIIGNINEDGYLTAGLDEMAQSSGCDRQHLDDILAVIHEFHPTGVGARDLRECLLLQLERQGHANSLAAAIVRDHLDALAAKKYHEITRALNAPLAQVMQAVNVISTLDPKPGRVYTDEDIHYITPDVIIEKVDGRYVVILNDEHIPNLRISNHYRLLLADNNTKPDVKSYIRDRIRSATFLIKSIQQRQTTIYKIATEIVAAQKDFLDHGVAHLKPLTMSEVAKRVGVHETTVSRAVSAKYVKTPGGIFEMRYFFTPGLKTRDGREVSNKAIRDMIAKLIENELPHAPLSDQEIVNALKKRGIEVARRTAAKYRIIMRIPPSHLRHKT